MFRVCRSILTGENQGNASTSDWSRVYNERLMEFQDIHQGEDCFILGNGPSLNQTDLSQLEGKFVFGLNKIYLIEETQKVDLSYIVAVNPLVIEQSAEPYRSMKIPVFVAKNGADSAHLSGSNILHIRHGGEMNFCRYMNGDFGEGYTVTYVALQIAFAMGFQRVFLVGVDHSFQQSGAANEEQVMGHDDPNHFHPDYFKGQKWNLADLEGSEVAYHNTLFQFRRAEREVYDATIGGKLTIFPKLSFEEAVAECKNRGETR